MTLILDGFSRDDGGDGGDISSTFGVIGTGIDE